jgi:hypothetical protein
MLELLKAIGQAYAEEFQAPKESRIESRVRECVSPGREDKFMEGVRRPHLHMEE